MAAQHELRGGDLWKASTHQSCEERSYARQRNPDGAVTRAIRVCVAIASPN
jgi:hypothetical protein